MYSMIMTTYHNPEYLKLCIDSISENSYYKTHQLFVHVSGYDKESIDYLKYKNIEYTVTEDVGMSIGWNICIDHQLKYDNTIFVSDDFYFTKNWDYHLHKWEIELDEKFPDYIKFIGYRWCEPNPGSFPPICDAGKTIDKFDVNKVNEYVSKYSVHDVGEWYFNCLFPTKILKICKFSPEFQSCCDIDFGMKLLKYLKDNNIKFLMLSVKDCYIYHFQRIASSKSKIPSRDNADIFEIKWNIGVGPAYGLLTDEVKRSISLIKGSLLEKDVKKDI